WFRPDGREMTPGDWSLPFVRALGMLLGGDAIPSADKHGQRITADTLLVLMNAHHEPLEFVLPVVEYRQRWEVLVDTRSAEIPFHTGETAAGLRYKLEGRAMPVMRLWAAASP